MCENKGIENSYTPFDNLTSEINNLCVCIAFFVESLW